MHRQSDAAPDVSHASDEVDLAGYLALAWRFKIVIIGTAIAAGAMMLAWSVSGPRVYESAVTFAATQSKIGESGQVVASTASFRPMVESLTTASQVIQELGLDQPPTNMRPSEFLERVMSLSEVRGTNLMRVTVTYTDPVLAAKIANSVASHAVEVARNVSSTEAAHASKMIKDQADVARERLDNSDARLKAYKQEAQVEAVRQDVNAQLDGRNSLLELVVEIASEHAKLTQMEQELATRKRIDTLTKTVDSEPLLNTPRSGVPPAAQLRSESVNELYQGLDEEITLTRAKLASLEKQKTELIDVRKLGAAKLAVLDHLYEIESRLARLQVDRDLAEKIYEDISQRYEVSRLQVVGRSAELEIIDPAVPADKPVSRQVARNSVVAAVCGVFFALAGVLLWQAAVGPRRVPAR